jgi:NOL1/NOP2/sun family putative RNA methylase
MEALLGHEAGRFFAALEMPEPGLRVNTLRLPAERFIEISPFELRPLAYPPAGFLVTEEARPGRHPYHFAGLYYLQDPGAMAVGAMLAPRPGERVLDLAAAPGGKATHIAALLQDQGVLVANDPHPGRARELAGNLERCGVRNALVTADSANHLAAQFGPRFDRVLLDAPCSGEAMFHKSAAARREWSAATVIGCARRQHDLLADAALLVRAGGRLVYSTCTFSPEEDEEVIARFLQNHPDFRIVELPDVPGADRGRPEWLPHPRRIPDLTRTVRLWPHRFAGAGHFVAALQRLGPAAPHRDAHLPAPAPAAAMSLWREFEREYLRNDASRDDGRVERHGDELFRIPAAAPPIGRLRVLRPGWWLGTIRKGRFEPAHALALGLRPGQARNSIDFEPQDPRLFAFLRGETLHSPGTEGWVVITVAGFPLGWGKRVATTVKNHLPKGLRRQA